MCRFIYEKSCYTVVFINSLNVSFVGFGIIFDNLIAFYHEIDCWIAINFHFMKLLKISYISSSFSSPLISIKFTSNSIDLSYRCIHLLTESQTGFDFFECGTPICVKEIEGCIINIILFLYKFTIWNKIRV